VVPSAEVELVKENKLDFSTVTENRELVDMTSPFGRSKRHIEFELPEDVTYAAGDYLTVLPENHPSLIERAARLLGMRPGTAVILHSTRGAMAASLPTAWASCGAFRARDPEGSHGWRKKRRSRRRRRRWRRSQPMLRVTRPKC
jgi:sulfite reductase alpha subunit-like flavoprotein